MSVQYNRSEYPERLGTSTSLAATSLVDTSRSPQDDAEDAALQTPPRPRPYEFDSRGVFVSGVLDGLRTLGGP
jgi:hypothetical protein